MNHSRRLDKIEEAVRLRPKGASLFTDQDIQKAIETLEADPDARTIIGYPANVFGELVRSETERLMAELETKE